MVKKSALIESPVVDVASTSPESIASRATQLVTRFSEMLAIQAQVTEADMTALVSGDMSIEQLATKYGEMSLAEADQYKVQLERVRNAIAVASAKLDVEQDGIQLHKKKALTVLSGLRSAFEVQAKAYDTKDAKDEAEHRKNVNETNNVARADEIKFRTQRNELVRQDNNNAIAHRATLNEIKEGLRVATRKGAQADLSLREFHAERKLRTADRVMTVVAQRG